MQPYNPIAYSEEIVRRITGKAQPFIDDPVLHFFKIGRAIERGTKVAREHLIEVIGCNLFCAHCYTNTAALRAQMQSKYMQNRRRELPQIQTFEHSIPDTMRVLVPVLEETGSSTVEITTGEPSLYRTGCVELTRALWEYNPDITVVMDTNGILPAEFDGYLDPLAALPQGQLRNRFLMAVSLKGTSPEEFQHFTGAEGRYVDHAYQALEQCYRRGIPAIPQGVTLNTFARSGAEQIVNEDTVAQAARRQCKRLQSIHPDVARLPIYDSVQFYAVSQPKAVQGRMRKGGYFGKEKNIGPKATREIIFDVHQMLGAPIIDCRDSKGAIPAMENKLFLIHRIMDDLARNIHGTLLLRERKTWEYGEDLCAYCS